MRLGLSDNTSSKVLPSEDPYYFPGGLPTLRTRPEPEPFRDTFIFMPWMTVGDLNSGEWIGIGALGVHF